MKSSAVILTSATLLTALVTTGCAASHHATQRSALGVPHSSSELYAVIDQPGTVTVETIASADWAVDRSGLINLKDPAAKAAGITTGDEPIQVYFHALRHPTRGLFLVDTGVERKMRDDVKQAAVRGLVASAMHLEKMKFLMPLGDWLLAQKEPVQGVLLTHLHLDHITGMADVPAGTAVYTGPGEAAATSAQNLFVRPNVDRALEGKAALSEWPFAPDATGSFEGVIDVFGDQMVWALWVPGHTPGSSAYLVRTPSGPVLLTGDACHTRWGWEHNVGPGSFSSDVAKSGVSLTRLRKMVADHPGIEVRLGHQK